MLSDETLRRIGAIDRDLIERRLRLLFERWSHGDVEGMVEFFAPDISSPSHGFWTGVKAPLYGRAQVAGAVRACADRLENIVSVLHEVVIDGDRAVVHRTAVGRRRDTGRRYQCDIIEFFRFRDGLIVELTHYPDAAVWAEVAEPVGP